MESQAPTQIVILGGSGDLARRKLLPALFDLFDQGMLPDEFSVVGFAHSKRTDEAYQAFVKDAITKDGHEHDTDRVTAFCSHVRYVQGSFENKQSYTYLDAATKAFAEEVGVCTNRLYYLAVPPQYYEVIFTNLHRLGLMNDCSESAGWARVLVEKPFGKDLHTAQKLDSLLSSLFKEEQIFRIDHYLAKEAVQNLLSFRFANTLLRSNWDNKHIQSVAIKMHETVDADARGAFYDGVGALRDVGQNHLLQLLALIAMDEPKSFSVADIRDERAKVLKKLRKIKPSAIETQTQRGQYEGFTSASGVDSQSNTETFFRITTSVDTKRMKGVPFTLEAGKAMAQKELSIEIVFHDIDSGPFTADACRSTENVLLLTLAPTQEMTLTLNAKAPGYNFVLEDRTLSFTCDSTLREINAYEKVLLDCIAGDQMLFTQTDEVISAWKFISPILEKWGSSPLLPYQKGAESVVE